MKFRHIKHWPRMAVLTCGLLAVAMTGCQSSVGGQTLPSAYYLRDDIQFFPAGPEFLLPNKARALEQYRLEQEEVQAGLADDFIP